MLPNTNHVNAILGDVMILVGRMHDIASGEAGLSLATVRAYREIWISQGYELPPEPTVQVRPKKPPVARHPREAVGTALKTRIENLITIKTGEGCGCQNLATEMDTWGIAGCEQRRDQIIKHLVANRSVLVDALKWTGFFGHAVGLAIEFIPDMMLRAGAATLLNQAIADARTASPIRPRHTSQRSPIVMELSPEQIRLRNAAQSTVPPEPDCFTGTPVIHFGAHLWPVRGNWEWHAERWNEVAAGINGRCIVGIVTDGTTSTIDEVRQRLSDRFELFEATNTKQGENPTFRELQKRIPQGQDDVLLYCHAKGVRQHTASSESVRLWTEIMYETVIHNTQGIVEKLAQGYKCFGSFRSFGDAPLKPINRWHYSGTFFAVRAKHLGEKTVKEGYGGVEAWPGDHFKAADAWNEFRDAPGFKFGYDLNAVYPAIVNAQMQWEVDRIGGPRCEQHKRELDWFLAKLSPNSHVLVIGSRNGGLEFQLQKNGHTTVSIDIDPQPDNTVENMIVGSSTDANVQAAVRSQGTFDVVFVDGDHSDGGVNADWQFAQSLNPRLIAFHDVAAAIKHRNEGCEVDRLWREIKAAGRKTDEKIVGCGWGGIGIVFGEHGYGQPLG